MDNFHLQVTPIEFAYHSKDPIALSCLIKKSMPSGGAPERRQLRPTTDLTSGRATFKEGATFAMNKEMELRDTRISLNFFNKNNCNAILIGSKDLQPHAVLELNLDNCSDPKAKLTLEIHRKETETKHTKKENSRPHQMGILRTEGQLREEAVSKSRVNPSIPTAYQISRRNYKQTEVSCHEEKKSEGRKSTSGKKGSYLQHRATVHGKTTKQPIVKNEERPGQSPMPRRQTPEPIRIGTKQEAPKAIQPAHKYAISKVSSRANHSHTTSNHTEPTLPYEQLTLEPERLNIRPYREDQNVENVNREGCIRSLEEEKKQKYRTITDKLQLIHDKIAHSKEQVENSENSSESEMSHNHRSYFEERQGRLPTAAVNSFTHLSAASISTPNILKESEESTSQKDHQRPNHSAIASANVEKQFQNIKSVKTKSPPSEKAGSFQTIPGSVLPPSAAHPQKDTSMDTIMNEREEEQIELQQCRQEIKKLKSDLSSALRLVGERDCTIKELQEELLHYQSLLQEKQGLLDRLNHQYELRFEEVYSLKERVAAFEDQRNRINEERKLAQQPTATDSGPSKLAQSLSGELVKAKKRILQSQSQLKFKENENRCLSLQIDNVRREKRNLQQEIQVLVSRDKNQMTRKASLARIDQINSNSLATHAKRENEALRNEVKLLQQKLESLNSLFQSLLSPEEKGKVMGNLQPTRDSSQVERRAKLLQEKCVLLEEELKNKKNQLAEVINIIWKHEDGDIMNDVLTLISTQSLA